MLIVRSLRPSFKGTHVLDLACGMGWYSRWMHSQGAPSARGVDLSEKLLSRAWQMSAADSAIVYERGDLDDAESLRRLLPESDINRYDL